MQDAIRELKRIAQAFEKLGPQPEPIIDIKNANAYVWHADTKNVIPIEHVPAVPLELLHGIDNQRDTLLTNTRQFIDGYPANNALLWGARGMGKSALIKAIHAEINTQQAGSLVLIEIRREDIASLPQLIRALSGWVIRKFIIFCDDLSFDETDSSYKSLKAALDGGIEGKPDHILIYATSNRRHLLPRDMAENEHANQISASDTMHEKISLCDRFGLWLGFHPCDQDMYLKIINSYIAHYRLPAQPDELTTHALQWAQTRGSRSGRTAWQFIRHHAGKHRKFLR